jgi:hypothetical protein
MITPIAEYAALVSVKARLSPAPLTPAAQHITETINRAIGEARAVIATAVEALPLPTRWHAHQALGALERHTTSVADLDVMLEAVGKLPADVDVDYEVARLRAEREGRAADIVRVTAVLVHAVADVRVDVPDADQPCTTCGATAGGHMAACPKGP